jgi:hypothetical protein
VPPVGEPVTDTVALCEADAPLALVHVSVYVVVVVRALVLVVPPIA